MKKHENNNIQEEANDYKPVFMKGKKIIIPSRDTFTEAYWKGYIGNERYATLDDVLNILGK